MRITLPIILLSLHSATGLFAQTEGGNVRHNKAIHVLIDKYSQARETRDTVLLKEILTTDVDQLVSNGEWRKGIRAAVDGMMRSSTSNPGSRSLIIESIRFLDERNAIADCRYEIQNADGSQRKMWSTFIVTYQNNSWKISAIRNMLPTGSQ
jgi:uncharacterized protein (TIGR02246 family)